MQGDQNYRLCIDGQLLQTTAWDRGMGKYVNSLLQAYEKDRGSSHITIIFNKKLELAAERKQWLKEILPEAELVFLELPGLTGNIAGGKQAARRQYDSFLSKTYKNHTVDFLILNLFTFDYCAAFPSRVRKMLLMYDLVPLAYWQDFSKTFGSLYLNHIASIYEADIIFSISEATKLETSRLLGISPEVIVNIGGAPIKAEPVSPSYRKKTQIPGRYLISPTADFPHKNNLNMVRAFSAVNEEFGNSLSLVLTSHFSESSKQLLGAHSENLIFSGNVDNRELSSLYNDAEAVVYFSKSEGLGLPLFEAIEADKPAAAASIDVFKEISSSAFYFAQPDDITAIQNAMMAAVIKEGWQQKQSLYQKILEQYTWKKSADIFAQRLADFSGMPPENKKQKLTVVMPSPAEQNSTIGQRLQTAHGTLCKYFNPTYFISKAVENRPAQPYFLYNLAPNRPIRSFNARRSFGKNTLLYGIDSSRASLEVLKKALARPGYILLETNSLHTLLHELIDQPVLAKLFPEKLTHAGAARFLEDLGNVIIHPRAVENKPHISSSSTGWELGEKLRTILEN